MSDDPVLAALARLEEGQARLRVDLMARMDVQADNLTQLRADVALGFKSADERLALDIGGNMGRADQAFDASVHNRQELGQLWRMIQRMQTRLDDLESKP